MGRYLSLWEIDKSKIPVDPKERGGGWSLLMAMVKESLEKGGTKDWGAFVGETSGYLFRCRYTLNEIQQGILRPVAFRPHL